MNKNDQQEGYYSSDDDVAWGPYTLREAKRDLRRSPLKINYRHTDLGLLTGQTKFQSDKVEVLDTSAYFTPDESLAAHRNEAFLEKMEKVINDGEESCYTSAVDTTTNTMHTAATPSGLSPILNNTNCYSINRLDSIQQTLVDDTRLDTDIVIVSSSEEDDDDSHVLVISDTSAYSPGPDPGILIKIEQPTQMNISDTFSEESITSISTSKQSVGESSDGDEVHEKNDIMVTGLNDTMEETEMMLEYGSNEVDNTSPQNRHLNASNRNFNVSFISDESSDEAVRPVNDLQKRIQSTRESNMMLGLNDTIEEMEMMLKYGPNYLMPGETHPEENGNKTPQHHYLMPDENYPYQNGRKTPQHPDYSSKAHNKNLLPGKFDYVKSPVAEYIRRNMPIQPLKFKLPEPITRPTPKFPQNSQFKDIISPIGVYIKSPAVCIRRNVVGPVVDRLNLADAPATSEEYADDTISMDLPEVIYVPSKNVVTKTIKQQTLPANIRKLVQTIEKHEKKTAKLKKDVITEKLLSEDLTNLTFSDPNVFENSQEQDISFVTVKYAVPE